MYFNKKILPSNIPSDTSLDIATEASNVNHQMKEEWILRDKYFPHVESFLPRTEHLLFKHIAKYEDKNATLLNSPYPLKTILFNEEGEDGDIVFRCLNIDKEELRRDIKKVPLPNNIKEKAAFVPLRVALFLILRYYMITQQPQKFKVICCYYGYSLYWKRYAKQFPQGVSEEVMIYTVNELTYRNLLKKLGTVKKLLHYIVDGRFMNYREQVVDACDEDIRYVLDQVQSDLGSKMVDISQKYYKNFEKGNVIFQGKTTYDDNGDQRMDNSVMSTVESLSQKYTSDFFMSSINLTRVKQASKLAKETSWKELLTTLEYVKNNVSTDDVHDFYASLFYTYLNLDDPRANVNTIRSLKFLAAMMDIIRKGNSQDKNIVKIRSYMDDWLQHGSNTFRISQRDATKISYRKGIYFYFILCVTNNDS